MTHSSLFIHLHFRWSRSLSPSARVDYSLWLIIIVLLTILSPVVLLLAGRRRWGVRRCHCHTPLWQGNIWRHSATGLNSGHGRRTSVLFVARVQVNVQSIGGALVSHPPPPAHIFRPGNCNKIDSSAVELQFFRRLLASQPLDKELVAVWFMVGRDIKNGVITLSGGQLANLSASWLFSRSDPNAAFL